MTKIGFQKILKDVSVLFFRETWKEIEQGQGNRIECYLSSHDSSLFVRLRDGRKIKSKERIDFIASQPKKIVSGRSVKKPDSDRRQICRGDSIGDCEKKLGIELKRVDFGPGRTVVDLEHELGLWIMLYRGKVDLIRSFDKSDRVAMIERIRCFSIFHQEEADRGIRTWSCPWDISFGRPKQPRVV